MRISLVEREQNRRARRPARKRRSRRRSRTFHSAIPQPQDRVKRPYRAGRTWRKSQRRLETPTDDPQSMARTSLWKGIHWRALLRGLPAVAILTVLIGLLAYTCIDARFFVYEAHVVGSRYVKAEQIYEIAGVHEQNIFWIQPRKVAERIARLPGIKSARVRCDLPAKVTITVDERKPIILWRTLAHGGDWWLDKEGTVLPYHGDTDSPETIFVVDSSDRQLEEGDSIQPREIVQWVQQLAAALPGARIFYYQGDRGLNFIQEVAGHKWPVYVGDGEDLPRKIQAVQALTDYLATHHTYPTYVDVRWPDLPVFGRAETAEARGGE